MSQKASIVNAMTYRCSACENEIEEFQLLCPWCGAWMYARRIRQGKDAGSPPVSLPDIVAPPLSRLKSNAVPIDNILGGGLVAGSSVLLTGPPGAGKSTLILQLLDLSGETSLYVSGEESVAQLKLRADRLRINSRRIAVQFETNVNTVAPYVRRCPPRLLVIDSIQTVYTESSDSLPGSVAQIRRCTYMLRRLAQEKGLVLFVVGQVTKGMQAAGPKMLEHAVDCVVSLDLDERYASLRNLKVVKNRFGPTGYDLSLPLGADGFKFRED